MNSLRPSLLIERSVEPMDHAIPCSNPIQVLVVDDKAVMRSLIKRILGDDDDIDVVASAVSGAAALGQMGLHDVDVVLMDIHMTALEGMTLIPNLIAAKPDLKIILLTSTSSEQSRLCVMALEQGAADYISKPVTHLVGKSHMLATTDFQQELISKIKNWGDTTRKKRPVSHMAAQYKKPVTALLNLPQPKQIVLRRQAIARPDAIAIGSSTGGPQALLKIVPHLKGFVQPVFITQHMPPSFTPILAAHLAECDGVSCFEAKDGMKVEAKTIYLAPGNFHMTVEVQNGNLIIRLNQNPPENFCRPAVDPMLRSLSEIYGSKLFIVMLTGMGVDGLKGATQAIANGAAMIAQDELSSVVWGMPAAVAHAGLCHAVLPLDDLGPTIAQIAHKGQPA